MEGAALFWTATGILIITYVVIISDRINRAVIALLGGSVMIIVGALTQDQAIAAINFNALGLLAGMMIIVGVARKSGLFGYAAITAAKLVRASPAGVMIVLSLLTALFSALLDNVTTVLLVVPVTFVIAEELAVPVYPFLVAEILASNIGGTATLIGDPPNILIGTAAHLSFNAFLLNLGPFVAALLVLQVLVNHFIWGIHLRAEPERRERLMGLNPSAMIQDRWLLACSLIVIGAVTLGLILAHQLHLEVATIALAGAATLILLETIPHHHHKHADLVAHAFAEVEWITLFFFVGLFVIVGGIERAGVLDWLAQQLVAATHGNPFATATGVLWGSALLSSIVDNIPFVTTMIPLIQHLDRILGGAQNLMPVWWALSLGACLGGNGTLIGASANLTVAGLAEKNGVRFSFVRFAAVAFPMMLASIVLAQLYLSWRYF
ncbi:MAG: ArsB/NhaD family transporter [Alphaproteobacteria bacterium]|nr:ArsB/NhaD family transporter [Alphaproteobacteria bacterium]